MTDIVIEIANKLELEVELNNGTVVKNAVNIAVEDTDDHFVGSDVETVLIEVGTSLSNKVDKVEGKGLSTNDYTTDEKTKLSGIADNAEVNVNADWDATDGDGQILNKPSTFPPSTHTHDDRYFTETEVTNALALKADETYVDTQDSLKADKTEVTALANKVPSTKELVTVTGKNQYYPIIEDNTGTILGRNQTQVWNGTAYVTSGGNCGLGVDALRNNTGTQSNGVGYYALSNNTGTQSNGVGYYALFNNTGSYSNGVGNFALQNNTGSNSNGFGYTALQNNTGAYSNGFGFYALRNNTGAYSNGVGNASLQNNTGAYSNGVGYYALSNNTGSNSNGFGYTALSNNTGSNNTALGYNSFSVFIPNPAGAKLCDYTAIDTTLKRATVTAHSFGSNGTYTLVNYSTTGTAIGGMAVGTVQIKIIDANTIEFTNGSSLQNITSQGTGIHTFTPSMKYSNTTSLGANTQPNRSNQVVLGSTAVDSFRFGGTFRTPASSSDTGAVGEFCYDSNYLYLCTAVNTWKRVALGGETW